MTRTFIMCKPDAVERGLVGEIIARIERKGLRIVAMDLRVPDTALAQAHYEEHADKPFFGELVTFLTRGPVVAMVVGAGVYPPITSCVLPNAWYVRARGTAGIVTTTADVSFAVDSCARSSDAT